MIKELKVMRGPSLWSVEHHKLIVLKLQMAKIDVRTSFCFDGYASGAGIDFDKIIKGDFGFSNSAGSIITSGFLDKYHNDIINATKGTGLFPSVKMAQMIIESSWGNGITAKQANNFFGIKADAGWKGEKKQFNTPKDGKPVNYFRVYKTPLESIKDHTAFLKSNSRYPKAGVFTATTPEEQITRIAKAGYAESGKYDKAIINLINAYKLKELDKAAGLTYKDNYVPESSPSTSPANIPTVEAITKFKKPISKLVPIVLILAGVSGLIYTGIMLSQNKSITI